ncbi:Liprin-beta-2 [Liparis tanakae]|uniref:Liprin-beta-2 n=1 Tax=Liparis tanakae TaxID=230148 RepID=A0A4Z2ICY7_9TELE|nr:Liprin-beta-2 [Liparis tanakae]
MNQELLHRTSLEHQKLNLLGEVSYLKLKLADMEGKQGHGAERQHKAETVVNFISELQEQMCRFQKEINSKIQEKKALELETPADSSSPAARPTESAKGAGSDPRPSCARTSEEVPEGPDGNTHSLEEGSSDADRQDDCGEETGLFKELRILKDKVEHLEDQKLQYEKKLKATKAEISGLQQLLLSKNVEIESLHTQLLARPSPSPESPERDQELLRLRSGMKSLVAANDEKDRRIEELTLLLNQCKQFREVTHTVRRAPPAVRSLSNGRTPSSSSEEEENVPMKNTDSASAKSADIKSEHVSGDSSSEIQSQKSPDGSEDGDSSQRKFEKVDDSTSGSNSPVNCGANTLPDQRAVGSPEYMKNNRSFKRLWGNDMNVPFSQWTKEQVCGWLEDYGLAQYVNLTRQWVENGQTLLSATPQDFEKEMGMKHPLHRKKLQLALKAFSTKVREKSSDLDYIWVTRWLDDIGLPQYKDHFHEARVDGRMIQYITVNDLLTLKVTSQLHHLSIKCAIHVLHANKFNPNCLRRRPGEEKQPSPSEVVQWSNHRVMEWLRAVDLAEYAPNLRGSGVHGGLIILEPRFSAETLALLLNIPPQKTLLRRHLATAFSTLVGHQATQEKREYGNATGHMPLTTTAKVKPKKLGFTQFSHLRKRKPDESADYICPIDSGALRVNGVSRPPSAALRGLSPALDRQAAKREQVGIKSPANGPKE